MQMLTKIDNRVSILFFCLTIFWILLRLPTSTEALADTDDGHQLAGAIQILNGEHPFVDYEATYGPFTFYASALAQIIFNNRLMGEYFLLMVGYAIAYALLARMIYRLTGNFWLTFLFGVIALAAIPRMYKYYIVLGPVLSMLSIWNYLEKPNHKNMLWMSLAITITGLFRADFGVYCTIAGLLGLFLLTPINKNSFKKVFIFLGGIFLFALPWILFLVLRGGLATYFIDMTSGTTNLARDISLPFPEFHPELPILDRQNLVFLAIIFFSAVPFIAIGWLFSSWGSFDYFEKRILLIAAVLNFLSLAQAYSRIGYLHLTQTIPLAFFLTAWMANRLGNNLLIAFRAKKKISFVFGLLLLIFFGFLSKPILLINYSYWPKIDIKGIYPQIVQFSLPKQQFLDNLGPKSESYFVQTALYIRRCTTAGQRVMGLPVLTTIPYITDRSFGGGQIGVQTGYFVTDKDQERVVQKMSEQDIPLIIYTPNLYNDGLPERRMAVVAPLVAGFMKENYVTIKKVGPALVLMRKDLKIDHPAESLANMSCPQP